MQPYPGSEGVPQAPKTPLCVSFADVKRSHVMGSVWRSIAVELPLDLGQEVKDEVGLL